MNWQPLTFAPVFQPYLWGGRRLETVLNKPLGPGPRHAESWEVVDHGEAQSVVASGPLAGQTLHQLVIEHAEPLLGDDRGASSFPLLFKYLDANQALSLQVHPNDAQAAQLDPPDLGKTEAWVILDADPGAVVYAGLREGVTREDLHAAFQSDHGAACMHQLAPQPGDCLFIPAGVPHALGAGLLVAEIQQSSNTTFRLHDWNRKGPDGPRPLHIEEGLAVINFDLGPVHPQTPQPTGNPDRRRLVACDKFVLDRLRTTDEQSLCEERKFHILSVLSGEVLLEWADGVLPLHRGETTLVPAAIQVRALPQGPVELLDMSLPARR